MKKILFISKYLSTNKNGFESRLSTIIKLFKDHDYKVIAITSSSSLSKKKFNKTYNNYKIDDVDYYFIKENINYSQYSLNRVLSWVNFEINLFKFNLDNIGFKPDIIYISSLSLFTILNGIYLKTKFKAKLVFEMRDLWPYFLYTTGKFSRFNPLIIFLNLIESYGIKKSDLIISLIPKIHDYLIYKGFPYKKNFSSTFPVIKEYFIDYEAKQLNLNQNNFNICYAGNFGFDNYLNELLCLISKLKDKSITFHFVGDGSQKNKLKTKFSFLNNVKYYEHVEYKDLHSILIRMDSLVLSFGFNDKYPLFGYELNKLNNYIMAVKPIIVLGKKENLHEDRGKFTYISDNEALDFENKINNIKNNYKYYLKIAEENKEKLLIRNNPYTIFKETQYHLENL